MTSLRGIGPVGGAPPAERTTLDAAPGFGEALDALLRRPSPGGPQATPEGVTFSRHAAARMESRGIRLDELEMAELGAAVDTLAKRGAKESLVLMDDHAFIVGVPDRKVITALTRQEAVGNVFTQIDSTVVVR